MSPHRRTNMPDWIAKLSFAGVMAAILLHSPLASAQIIPNRYILMLEDPPVSARFSTRADLQGAQASAYRRQIEARQAAVKMELESRKFTVTGSVSLLQNAIFVTSPAARVDELKSI